MGAEQPVECLWGVLLQQSLPAETAMCYALAEAPWGDAALDHSLPN